MGANERGRGVMDPTELGDSLRRACQRSYGVVDAQFLCQPISSLEPHDPIVVSESTIVSDVMESLQANKVGCVLVENENEELVGIFSERDYVLKVYGTEGGSARPVKDFMTPEPITVSPVETVAYALNLMSQGGFRHLPIVDEQGVPIGMMSVKDAIDRIATSFIDDLLNFSGDE